MSIAGNPLLRRRWYYSLELEPGVWTEGLEAPNICLTRELLAGIELAPAHEMLDIGTQEGLVPILIKRQGVERVTAYDLYLFRDRLDPVQTAFDTSLELVGGFPIPELGPHLARTRTEPFDVVVFGGVLYHMVDPFAGIAAARSLVRTGGLAVVETKVVLSEDHAVHLDLGRASKNGINFLSANGFETMLRAVGLEPIDAVWHLMREAKPRAKLPWVQLRMATVCRALGEDDREPGLTKRDSDLFIRSPFANPGARAPIGYAPAGSRAPLGGSGLHEAGLDPARRITVDDRVRLALSDMT